MTVSALRTLTAKAALSAYGLSFGQPVLRWPAAEPGDVLDYSLDMAGLMADAGDFIVSASVSARPSGVGELQVNTVVVSGTLVTAWLSGGVPGRSYTVKCDIATLAGRTFEVLVALPIDVALGVIPIPTPPSAGFGTAGTWAWAPEFDFANPLNSMYL